jgi:redox-sensitive bicupin YhaK (pirin superfamily)
MLMEVFLPKDVVVFHCCHFGLQAWVALPKAHEETAPTFIHHAAETMPFLEGEGVRMHVLAGALHGKRSPVKTFFPLPEEPPAPVRYP